MLMKFINNLELPRRVFPDQGLGIVLLLAALAIPWPIAWWHSIKAFPRVRNLDSSALRPVMVVVPAGKFQMKQIRKEIIITKSFAISESEVTQGQYAVVMNQNPSYFNNRTGLSKLPVESVSWFDAIAYCNKLSLLEGLVPCYKYSGGEVTWPEGLACRGYRLPTQAEWVYAAQANQDTRYSGSDDPEEVAWLGESFGIGETHPIKEKQPNQWGLYDLSGNVWEWVWDWYAPNDGKIKIDPIGPPNGDIAQEPFRSHRVCVGGSTFDSVKWGRVTSRSWYLPDYRSYHLGFRVSRSYPPPELGDFPEYHNDSLE